MRFLLIIIFLTGCASQPSSGLGGKQGTPFPGFESDSENSGYIYVYRPEKFFWFKAYPNVSVNGEVVGELRNGTYIVVSVPEGEHSVTVHRNGYWGVPDSQIKLFVKNGDSAFVEVQPHMESLLQVILVAASAGLMAETTGVGVLRESDFEGAASSTAEEKKEENMEPIFQKLLRSNKYHITIKASGTSAEQSPLL